jgi:hypothetical protein
MADPYKKPTSSIMAGQNTESSQLSEYSTVDERALVRKIDLRILPVLVVVYIMAFIDRYVLEISVLRCLAYWSTE